MEVVVLWFVLAIIVGIAANTRGRSGIGWFFLAVITSPLIAGLLLLALPRKEPDSSIHHEKTCPQCAEQVKMEALVCHFCGYKFTPEDAQRMAEFPHQLGDYRYRIAKNDRSVLAVNCRGERIKFHDWESFWKTARPD